MGSEEFTIAGYNKYLAEHKLMASRCERCQILFLPPRPVCPQCHNREMSWQQLNGDGRVLGFTSIAIVPTTMTARGFGRDNPYMTAVVQMEEGPALAGMLQGVDAKDPESTKVGMPVVADYMEEGEGDAKQVTLVFRPR